MTDEQIDELIRKLGGPLLALDAQAFSRALARALVAEGRRQMRDEAAMLINELREDRYAVEAIASIPVEPR